MECPWCAMELESGIEVCPYCKERVVVGLRRRNGLRRLWAVLALIGFTILLLGTSLPDLLRFFSLR
jgi:hypothetical protein